MRKIVQIVTQVPPTRSFSYGWVQRKTGYVTKKERSHFSNVLIVGLSISSVGPIPSLLGVLLLAAQLP